MAVSRWPPGVLYIFQTLQSFAPPLLVVFAAQWFLPYSTPRYIWMLVYVLVIPVLATAKTLLQNMREEREIKKLGARRVPQIRTSLPGGLDASLEIVNGFTEGLIPDIWDKFDRQQGLTWNLRLFWEDVLFTSEPEYIKTMLATDFDNYEKGWKFKWYTESLLGNGVFNSDGELWKFHRGLTRPFFARDRVTEFELFDRHANVLIENLKTRFSEGDAINFQDAIGRFTMDSATDFLFGSCVESLSASLPRAPNSTHRDTAVRSHPSDKFAAAFSQVQHQIGVRNWLTDAWPLAEFWKDKTKDSMDVINAFLDPILRHALAKKSEMNEVGIKYEDEEGTLLDHLVMQTDDYVITRDETLNIMIAGRDTMMATLTFVVYCLSQHPAVLATLREEIMAQVGPSRRPTIDDVRRCKYLRAVINETLRLYPPVPFNVRRSKHSSVWQPLDGGKPYYIPKGVDISYSVWMMHRRTDLWGPDAREFDPERFLDARLHKYLTPNPYIFLPFNAGPRICLGQQFAYNEASFMLVRLLQTFDTITLAPDAQPLDSRPPASWASIPGRQGKEKIWPRVHLTAYSYKGLWLRMGEAERV